MQKKRYLLIGALFGLIVPVILFGIFSILSHLNVEIGKSPLSVLIIFTLALLEAPIAIIGRSLNLPIETGGAAFILFQFNAFGYFLTLLFWTLVGLFVGWLISIMKKSNHR